MLLKVSQGMFLNLDFFERVFALEVPWYKKKATLVAGLTYWDGELRLVEGIVEEPFEGSLKVDGLHFIFADLIPSLLSPPITLGFVVTSVEEVSKAALEGEEGKVFLAQGKFVRATDHGIEMKEAALRVLVQGPGEGEDGFLEGWLQNRAWILV